ncbi:c-type cytochrome [Methylibium sp.]|uniref:c-type cytochrome n=1 Tax=Methylibium sp. TaxID=2067992 RepID=UPI003D0A661E
MKTLFPAMIALLLTGFAAATQAQDKAGDAAAGQNKNAMCIGCHGITGYQASFPEIYKVPMIAGQNAKYIVAALNAYKKGDRKHPTMRGIADSLSEQDMADLAAYYETQGGPRAELPATPVKVPGPEVAELLKKGSCAACHGENFSKPIDGSYPKLAGQHGDYLYVALKAYGTQGNANVGRAHAIMGAQVKAFSHTELKGLSGYIASLPSDLKTVPQSKFK